MAIKWFTFLLQSLSDYQELHMRVRVMMLNATFNIILGISWQSVLLVGENRVPKENDIAAASH
jgi:hypothetical protein